MQKASAAWIHGVNSVRNSWGLPEDQLKWAINTSIRGGIVQTRPGQAMRLSLPTGNFQGGIIFNSNKIYAAATSSTFNNVITNTAQTIYNYDGTPSSANELSYVVFCVDGKVYFSPFPLVQPKNWSEYQLTGIQLSAAAKQVYLCIATQSASTSSSGDVIVTPSNRVLMIQDGVSAPAYWDGSNTTGAQSAEIPTGTWMAYSGNRLWVANGNIVLASDLGNPLNWKERQSGASRGDFSFPRPVTALFDFVGQNNDTKLYVFTDRSTFALASGILDRTLWATTPNFTITLFPHLGCIAGKSIAVQAGMLWWYSQGGLISADVASSAYLSSQVLYKDVEMAKAKRYMAPNYTGVCAVSFENYLLYSIPYLETLNSITMVMDYAAASESNQSHAPAWAGVWTGTHPVIWTTGIIDGTPRAFHFSVDYTPTNDGSYIHFWESFLPERYDKYLTINQDGSTQEFVTRIYSQMETGMLGDGMDYKQFKYGEIECQQIGGTVDVTVSYRGSKGTYLPILKTRLLAATEPYQYAYSPEQDNISNLGYLNTQYRRLTTEDAQRSTKLQSCESKLTLDVDKAFSFLIEWCGEFGVEAIRMFMDPWAEKSIGTPDSSETKYCVVGEQGSTLLVDLPLPEEENPKNQQRAYFSTQTASVTYDCNSGDNPPFFVTATASYSSYVSFVDAQNQAYTLALNEANAVAGYFINHC
jgi:hypothetical protein